MTEKNLKILGWIGTFLSVLMYVSYIPQIMGNLSGNKTPFLQPLAAAINCTIWITEREKRFASLSSKSAGDYFWIISDNNCILIIL